MNKNFNKKLFLTVISMIIISCTPSFALIHWNGLSEHTRFRIEGDFIGDPISGVTYRAPKLYSEECHLVGLERKLEEADFPQTDQAVIYEDEYSYVFSMENNMAQAKDDLTVPTYGVGDRDISGNKYPLLKTKNEYTTISTHITHVDLRDFKACIEYIHDCINCLPGWTTKENELFDLCVDRMMRMDEDIDMQDEIEYDEGEPPELENPPLGGGYWVHSTAALSNRTWVYDDTGASAVDIAAGNLPKMLVQGKNAGTTYYKYPSYEGMNALLELININKLKYGDLAIYGEEPLRELTEEQVEKAIKLIRGDSISDRPEYHQYKYRYYKFYGLRDDTLYGDPEAGGTWINQSFLCGTNIKSRDKIMVYNSDAFGHLTANPTETFWFVDDESEIEIHNEDRGDAFRTIFFETYEGDALPSHLSFVHKYCAHNERGCECADECSHEGCTDCTTCQQSCPTRLSDDIYCDFYVAQTRNDDDYNDLTGASIDLGGNFTQQFAENPEGSFFGKVVNDNWIGVPGYAQDMAIKMVQSPENLTGDIFIPSSVNGRNIKNLWFRYQGQYNEVGASEWSGKGFDTYSARFRVKLDTPLPEKCSPTEDAASCPKIVLNQFWAFSKGGTDSTLSDYEADGETTNYLPFKWLGAPVKTREMTAYQAMAMMGDAQYSFRSSPDLNDFGMFNPNIYERTGTINWNFSLPDEGYWIYNVAPSAWPSDGEDTNGLVVGTHTPEHVKERTCNTLLPRGSFCTGSDHMCTAKRKFKVVENDVKRLEKLYKFTLVILYPRTTCASPDVYYEIEDQKELEQSENMWQYHAGNVCMPEQTANNNTILASENIHYIRSNDTDSYDADFYTKDRIRTNSLNPIYFWDKDDNVKKVFGFQDRERVVGSHDASPLTNYTTKNSITLNVWEKQNGGSLVWPYAQTKLMNPKYLNSFQNFYTFTGVSSFAQLVTCTYGTSYGEDATINTTTLANRIGKPTIRLESAWDSHTSTLNGLRETGILDANGGDTDCVVHGGSTVYLKTADSDPSNTDKITMLFNGYIPIYYRNRGDSRYVDKDGDIINMDHLYDDDGDVDITDFNELGFLYDRDVSSYDFSYSTKQNYPFDITSVYDSVKNLAKNIEANLNNIRLELYVAPGIYRQGEEKEFMEKATCVSGPDRDDSFNGRDLDPAKKYYLSEGGMVSPEQSSGIRVKLNTDIEHGEGITYFNALIDLGTDPGKKGNPVKLHLYHNNVGDVTDYYDYYDYVSGIGNHGDDYTAHGSHYRTDANLDIKNDIKTEGRETTWENINSRLNTKLKSAPRWLQLNQQTGFLSNLIYAIDLNCGGEKSGHQAIIESRGDEKSDTSHRASTTLTNSVSFPPLRQAPQAINGVTTGNGQGWFNEGLNDLGIVEFQLEFEVNFSELDGTAIDKWLCINPTLTGKQNNAYDQRNWTDNNNDGSVDHGTSYNDLDITKPGAMKDKIRTAKFITTNYCAWDDIEDALDPDLLGISGLKYEIYRNANLEYYGNKNYVGSLFICDDTFLYLDYAESVEGTHDLLYEGISVVPYDSGFDDPHYCNLPIFADFDNILSSKFFYIDNVEV